MNDLLDSSMPITDAKEIVITMHMTNGENFVQHLPIDCADGAEDLLKWFRNPKKFTDKTWAWKCLNDKTIHIFHHSHVVAIDIEGFIEPDGRYAKWYERAVDKIRSIIISMRLKRRRKRG